MGRRLRHPRRFGVVTRGVAMVLGAALALGGMLAMQVPLSGAAANATLQLSRLGSTQVSGGVQWPSVGSASLLIPSLGVSESVRNAVVPIASLTKMMTAFVVLRKYPLTPGETGPCVTVSASDYATYEYMKSTDQSNVPVIVGESLCESQLLDGLLVHSADNYAAMLADLVSGSQTDFVTLMNETAHVLGLRQTTYADASGYDPASVSSALDQARLANVLMQSPVVRDIVRQSSVVLPVGGLEGTYTPYVGTNNVIGVKSGRTSEAGGCDVMAMTFTQGTTSEVLYAVVLGQRGGDLLGPAGDAALALARSALAQIQHVQLARGQVVGSVGWPGSRTAIVLAAPAEFWWWGRSSHVPVRITLRRFTGSITAGETVGTLRVAGPVRGSLALVARRDVAPPSLWQRLR
jgi:serine-type D-Ala-D-Ala carboxypeptidase (penicillin-binding protein 5/6)